MFDCRHIKSLSTTEFLRWFQSAVMSNVVKVYERVVYPRKAYYAAVSTNSFCPSDVQFRKRPKDEVVSTWFRFEKALVDAWEWLRASVGLYAPVQQHRLLGINAKISMSFLTAILTFGSFLANFERLVLGCIEAEFCKQIVKTPLQALDEIYKICTLFAPFSIQNFSQTWNFVKLFRIFTILFSIFHWLCFFERRHWFFLVLFFQKVS